MNKKNICKYVVIAILLAGIIYFGCRLAKAGSDSDCTKTESSSIFNLNDLDEVGIPYDIASIKKQYEGFSVNFNPDNKTPNFVAWVLMGHETEGASSRSNKFWKDNDLDGCPDTRDYSYSGYDRGHMCPAGEQKWSDEAMHNSFVMANICPQKHELNSGAWKTLEEKERIWARRDSALVIVAGPVYATSDTETIGDAGVRVPSAFFKVILAPYASPVRGIGFVYPNMKCDGNMANYATSIDEVEKLTGFDFFRNLPDDIEEEVESVFSFKEWNNNRK